MNHELEIQAMAGNGRSEVLRLTGRLDARSSNDLLERCREVTADHHLVLNLAGVTFLSSSGIGALLVLTEQFAETGRTVRLACPSETVRSAIQLLSLETFLPIHDSEEEALAA